MEISEFILKSLEESKGDVDRAIKTLSPDELSFQPKPHSNSIVFLIWHLARVEDLWINKVLKGTQEIYETDGWYKRFGTADWKDNGIGFDIQKLTTWPAPKMELLQAYAAAVRAKTRDYLGTLKAGNLDETRELRWGSGKVGSVLSHLITEVSEHSGQIGYIKGILKGIEPSPPPPKM